ncbi:hypothetical protein [Streptomyces nanshensis]|uniref:Uncharacterized protein n=1 Tax=Streptomyces nanshensis TaxID=518642 RepID=A0A1E7LC69_9ACTN|nr:hypothetical protein [Streptomyces nanshensis]OEV13805.1 hypothetical protein AN218_01860 [Streptomyces nanshensis]
MNDELKDVERTTEELAEIMASGNTVRVFVGEILTFEISLSEVALNIRLPFPQEAVRDLTSGVEQGDLRLSASTSGAKGLADLDVDNGQAELLKRALVARRSLLAS